MARQRRNIPELKKCLFGRDIKDNSQQRTNDIRANEMVDKSEQYLAALPEFLRKQPGAREAMDVAVTAQYLPSDRRAQIAAGSLLGAAALGSIAQAYNDQASDYLPTNPLAVTGRMVSNLNPLGGSSIGADALAQARNNVATAAQLVGSEEVLEAVAMDQLNEMRGINQAAMTPMEVQENMAVQKMIDARASQLMQQPIQRADGSVAPMGYDRAMRLATDQINMELRAGQVY
jgi:hypothetical protein